MGLAGNWFWSREMTKGNDEGKKACNNNVIVLYIH